jgi:hypothetical protein
VRRCQRSMLKPTPIWDELGCGGTPREGGRALEIAGIGYDSDIPRMDAKGRGSGNTKEGRTLPMMNADVNDRKARVEDSHKMARPDFDFFHQPAPSRTISLSSRSHHD